MNILVIGNGFDLAHGLPTKYGDFLSFCEKVSTIYSATKALSLESYEKNQLSNWKIDEKIKKDLQEAFASRKEHGKSKWDTGRFETDNPILDEFYSLIKDNLWVEYFKNWIVNGKENWIDFEGEISKVIQAIDNDMHGLANICKAEDKIEHISIGFLDERYRGSQITYQELKDRLLNDLDRLIRALEIYLYEFVQKIDCKKISPDIKEIMTYSFEYVDKSTKNKISKVLSFNYTLTFEYIYFNNLEKLVENVDKTDVDYIDYIHGKADINHTIESNNMVLGIDEYLPNDRKDRDTEFIAFKKFYQRIYKGTGCKYKEWVDEIQSSYERSKEAEENCVELVKEALKKDNMDRALEWLKSSERNYKEKIKKHNLYIFGHSLDVTDKDILRDLILNDNVYTTIYYHKTYDDNGNDDNGRSDLGIKIANLIKVIGQDELIKRTGGSTKTIEFKLQQDMVERV